MKPATRTATELPEALVSRIGVFERRLRRIESAMATLAAVAGILAAYALLFLLDRAWDTPPVLRALLLGTAAAAIAVGGVFWARHWIWRRRDARSLARLVQRHHRGLGDRLLGAVELGDHPVEGHAVSPALRRAAIRQVAEEAQRYDFQAAVPRRGARRLMIVAASLAALVGVAFGFAPEAGRITLRRWLRPAAAVPRYTFARLLPLPEERVVARGEPFGVTVRQAPEARWRPSSLTARLGPQPPVTALFEQGVALLTLAGPLDPERLDLAAGDASASSRIVPVHRSELMAWTARIHPPDYLGRAPFEAPVRAAHVDVPEGGHVDLEGRVNRALQSAAMLEPEARTIEVDASRFRLAGLAPGVQTGGPAVLRFAWVDHFGLEGAAPARLTVQARPDEPPRIHTEGMGRFNAVLRDEVLSLRVRATDDHGLRALWASRKAGDAEPVRIELPGGDPEARELEGEISFSAALLGIPDETLVQLTALAADYHPARKPSRSETFRIYVMSAERHAEELRRLHERLQARLESIMHATEGQILRHEAMDALDAERLMEEATAGELAASEQMDRDLAQQLRDLAADFRDLALEGLRNPGLEGEMIEAWSELADTAMEVADGAMNSAAEALAEALASAEAQERSESLEEALAREREALETLREVDQQAADTMEMLLARGFVRRLRALARFHGGLGRGLLAALPATIGLPPEALRPAARVQLDAWQEGGDKAYAETRDIMDDLAGFARRSGDARYSEVREAMREVEVEAGLLALAEEVARNHGVSAIGVARRWETAFNAWADLLEPDEDGGGGGDGEGDGGDDDGLDMETVIALLRTAVRQEMLREQTRLLDRESPASGAPDGEAARGLAGRQRDLSGDLRAAAEPVEDARIREFIDYLVGVTDEAAAFLDRPQVDGETRAIQTEVIERIAQLFRDSDSEGEGEGSPSPSAAMARQIMAMMMEAAGTGMGMGPGGGGDGGGDGVAGPARPLTPGGGDPAVETSGGGDPATWPEAYRALLQAFFDGGVQP